MIELLETAGRTHQPAARPCPRGPRAHLLRRAALRPCGHELRARHCPQSPRRRTVQRGAAAAARPPGQRAHRARPGGGSAARPPLRAAPDRAPARRAEPAVRAAARVARALVHAGGCVRGEPRRAAPCASTSSSTLQGPESTELIGPLTAAAENAPPLDRRPAAARAGGRRGARRDVPRRRPCRRRRASRSAPSQPRARRRSSGPWPSSTRTRTPSPAHGRRRAARSSATGTRHASSPTRRCRTTAGLAGRRARRRMPRALQRKLFDAPVLLHYIVPGDWDRYARRPRTRWSSAASRSS